MTRLHKWWCGTFHEGLSWPFRGEQVCVTCARRFPSDILEERFIYHPPEIMTGIERMYQEENRRKREVAELEGMWGR